MGNQDQAQTVGRDEEIAIQDDGVAAAKTVVPGNWRHGLIGFLRSRAGAARPAVISSFGRPALRWRPPLYLLSLVLFVVLPSIASQFYLIFIASDQYVATARFAVRPAESSGSDDRAALAAVGGSGGLNVVSLAGQDAHVVVAYIRSRAIVDDLSRTLDIRAIYSRPNADFWARLKPKASAEDLTAYWQKMVTAGVDGPSGIVTVRASAFTPEDALTVANAVISASETLVNDVSARARQDAVSRAEDEVRRTQGLVQNALTAMRDFREKVGYVDPVSTATVTSKLITDAMAEKIRIENELFVAQRAMSAEAPTLTTLKSQLESVNTQIDKLKATLTGNSADGQTIAASLATFENLELNRMFAEKMYTMAQDALERARLKADRQNIYVSVFVPPGLPQDASYPERLAFSIIIPLSLLIVWGIFALLAATIEDHRN